MCNQQLTHAARTCSLQIAHVNLWLFAHLYNTNSLLFSTIYTKYYQETLLLLASTAAKMAVSWLKGSCSLKGPCHVPNFIWCCQQHSFWRREHRWRRWWAWISSSSVNLIRGTATCRGSFCPKISWDMDRALPPISFYEITTLGGGLKRTPGPCGWIFLTINALKKFTSRPL